MSGLCGLWRVAPLTDRRTGSSLGVWKRGEKQRAGLGGHPLRVSLRNPVKYTVSNWIFEPGTQIRGPTQR